MPPSPERPAFRARRDRRRVVLFSATRDWHARKLTAALRRRGLDVSILPIERCAFDSTARSGLRFGLSDELPDGIFVRTISAGSFEAVTRRLGVLHALSALGVPVWNSAAAIERCVDKSMTAFLLARAGLATPPSWTVEGYDVARALAASECPAGPIVLKPLFGSQGRGLLLIRSADDLPSHETVAGVYHLQRFVGGTGPDHRDFRVFVVDGVAIAAMARRSRNWITNVARGGRAFPTPLDGELRAIAVAAAAAVGASFCGVDILRSPDGTAYVLEVNSMPAWSGLQSVVSFDIADRLAEHFCAALRAGVATRVA